MTDPEKPLTPALMRSRQWLTIALTALACIAAYGPSLRGGYLWDDRAITENPLLVSLSGLAKLWFAPAEMAHLEAHYWPVVYSTFWIEHAVVGFSPFVSRLVNLLLHVANSLLVGAVLARVLHTLPAPWMQLREYDSSAAPPPRLATRLALVVSLLFALHPVHVESVAWIIERKDLLSGIGYLLATWWFLDYVDHGRRRALAAALAAFAFALLSKSVVVTLPVALALLLCFRAERPRRAAWIALIPFALLAAAHTALDLHIVAGRDPFSTGRTLLQRIDFAAHAIDAYLLSFAAAQANGPVAPRIPDAHALRAFSPWLLLLLLAIATLIPKRPAPAARTASPVFPASFALLLFPALYVLTLLPTLGLIDYGFLRIADVADRFQYLASAWAIAFVVLCARHSIAILQHRASWMPTAARAVAGVVVLLTGFLTSAESAAYRDMNRLFALGVARNPDSATVRLNAGQALARVGAHEAALKHYEAALRLEPPSAVLWLNIGFSRQALGQLEEARAAAQAAAALDPNTPSLEQLQGTLAEASGDLEAARRHFELACKHAPRSARPRLALARVLAARDPNDPAAFQLFEEAARLEPRNPEIPYRFGLFLQDRDARIPRGTVLDYQKPILKAFNDALAIDPAYLPAATSLANALAGVQRRVEGIAILERALALHADPRAPADRSAAAAAHNALGVLRLATDVASAVAPLRTAIELNPGQPAYRDNLGVAYARSGNLEAAVAEWQAALERDPNDPARWNNLATALRNLGRADDAARAELRARQLREARKPTPATPPFPSSPSATP